MGKNNSPNAPVNAFRVSTQSSGARTILACGCFHTPQAIVIKTNSAPGIAPPRKTSVSERLTSFVLVATTAYRINGRQGGKRTPSDPAPVSMPMLERSLYPADCSTGIKSPPSARIVTPEAPVNVVKNAQTRTVTITAPPRTPPNMECISLIRRFDESP